MSITRDDQDTATTFVLCPIRRFQRYHRRLSSCTVDYLKEQLAYERKTKRTLDQYYYSVQWHIQACVHDWEGRYYHDAIFSH